jgi:YtkA-like
MKTNKTFSLIPLFLGLFYLSGCSAEEMMPLHTVSSGSETIEILTPGGRLKSGNNPVIIRRSSDATGAEIHDAELMFSMPAMGSMPYMEMQTVFASGASEEGISGNLTFNMGGSWTGHFSVTLGDSPVTATFPTRVDD